MRTITADMVSRYCDARLSAVMPSNDVRALRAFLLLLVKEECSPPYWGAVLDLSAVADVTSVPLDRLRTARSALNPIFDAIRRSATKGSGRALEHHRAVRTLRPPRTNLAITSFRSTRSRREASPTTFSTALRQYIEEHGDTVAGIVRELAAAGMRFDKRALCRWRNGVGSPRSARSRCVLAWIERRYDLAPDALASLLRPPARATFDGKVKRITSAERRRYAWHLPDDFDARSPAERDEVLAWVRANILGGNTEYRRYQMKSSKQAFALRFDAARRRKASRRLIDAPDRLQREMNDLIAFKTATLTATGMQRNGAWGRETAAQKVEHLGLMFGALASAPDSDVQGAGVPRRSLTFAMLVFPGVWDWYLGWRERRRGMYTAWEVDMLSVVLSMVRTETGWLRQRPELADRLSPIDDLVSADDIAAARADWNVACDTLHRHGRNRIRELSRVLRVHRDPFEPILPILEADSPVSEYRKITEEIARLTPDEHYAPCAAAEATRSFLMLRLGLHTGLRQRNLRELLLCPADSRSTPDRVLEERRRGELRWNARDGAWEIFAPAVAFKNARSSFFGSNPFRLQLPDLCGLYAAIEVWIARHRGRLLGRAADPGTFFVKTVKFGRQAEYCQNTFYEAWRQAIQRYGIHNPYTGRGAIVGLLPHGPHNVRDVLATHVLKKTGSYEQASYAIQDTPEIVRNHYGRFLPHDKAAIAARILNRAWEDS